MTIRYKLWDEWNNTSTRGGSGMPFIGKSFLDCESSLRVEAESYLRRHPEVEYLVLLECPAGFRRYEDMGCRYGRDQERPSQIIFIEGAS